MGTIKLFEIPIYALSEKKLKEKVHQKEENLREKIKDHPSWSISTVWGIGYKFEVK